MEDELPGMWEAADLEGGEADNDWASKCPFCGNLVVLGVEVQGVYDGTLIWECGVHHRWPRFPPPGRLHDMAVEIITKWEEQ